MRRYSLSFAVAVALTFAAIPARAAEESQAAQQQREQKVWTNEDLDALRARGLISIVGTISEAAPAAPPPAAAYSSRFQDPGWYAEQAIQLQTRLNERMAALLLAQQNLAQARSLRQTAPGITLGQANPGTTPEEGIAILQAQVSEAQSQFDELADLARRNYIPPGVLRPAAA